MPAFSNSQLRPRKMRIIGGRGEFGHGLAAQRPQRLTCCWCDSASMPRIMLSTLKCNKGEKSQRIRWSDSVLPDIYFLYLLLPFSSQLKIKLPTVRVTTERQASLRTAVTHPPSLECPSSGWSLSLGECQGRFNRQTWAEEWRCVSVHQMELCITRGTDKSWSQLSE